MSDKKADEKTMVSKQILLRYCQLYNIFLNFLQERSKVNQNHCLVQKTTESKVLNCRVMIVIFLHLNHDTCLLWVLLISRGCHEMLSYDCIYIGPPPYTLPRTSLFSPYTAGPCLIFLFPFKTFLSKYPCKYGLNELLHLI